MNILESHVSILALETSDVWLDPLPPTSNSIPMTLPFFIPQALQSISLVHLPSLPNWLLKNSSRTPSEWNERGLAELLIGLIH